jgi:hypothetical protein
LARRHAVLIIALANAREIHLTLPHDGALRVDLSRSARELELVSPMRYNKGESIITGPGAAALQTRASQGGMALPRVAATGTVGWRPTYLTFTLRAPRRCVA